MSSDVKEGDSKVVLQLAQLFSTCVECFGLIHPSKDYERAQLLPVAQLGIQQARLLAWGDSVGICTTNSTRDARLDDPDVRRKIEQALQSIIDRPAHVHRTSMMENYGLKPPKKFTFLYQPALDTARLEVFRAKFEILNNERWEVRRGMSVTANHWCVIDPEKFKNFVVVVKENVDDLINLMDNVAAVDRAVKSDIRALGWHPIFDRVKATSDTSKLRLIRDACKVDYPEYVQATEGALAYIEREWKDNYEEIREKGRQASEGSEIPGSTARFAMQAAYVQALHGSILTHPPSSKKEKGRNIFGFLKTKSWRRNSEEIVPRAKSEDETATRSQSIAVGTSDDSFDVLEPTRSKSISVIPMRSGTSDNGPETIAEDDPLNRVETAKDVQETATIEPVASMVSRHDQHSVSR